MRKILLFVDQNSGSRGRLFLQLVQDRLSGNRIQICEGFEACAGEVRRISASMERPILVFFVTSRRSLDTLYTEKQLFEDKKIVMVLPEEKTDQLTAMVHRFFPRYVAVMDGRYEDLCEVLNKMIVQ